MGPHVLYEPQFRVWGYRTFEVPELPAVLAAGDEPVEIELSVPQDKLQGVWVGVLWVVPKRWVPHAAGSRIRLAPNDEMDYETWQMYLWRWWPRKVPGRWVRLSEGKIRAPLYVPEWRDGD
ncbi:hypothetical protein ACFPPE_18930 [Agromyces tardus]|nr:hypothetical protein [Agromyces tardus]